MSLQGASRRQVGLSGIPLDYLLRLNNAGKYDTVWNSREEKIKNCVIFVGKLYKDDTESLYTLLVQHIGTSGNGSNIISKHKNSTNGRRYYLDLKGHFMTDSHDQTK